MLVLIDESGCSGVKFAKGSSPFFTIVLLLFTDLQEAARAERHIVELRRALHLSERFEFHFSKVRQDFREAFLRAIAPVEFSYFAVTINKKHLAAGAFNREEALFRHACSLAFESATAYLHEATVIIDGSGGRVFRRELASYLRQRLSSALISKLKVEDSARNDLLQMADMVCGAVARSYTNKPNAEVCAHLVARRETVRIVWP
jgi:hypothetical protein